jgi:predicted GNAT family N-acyltransferase
MGSLSEASSRAKQRLPHTHRELRSEAVFQITAIDATHALMEEALALRHQVFVVEQRVPQELEVDDDDKIATHLVALSQGRIVGTLRIVLHGCTAKIGRMAVSASRRKNGIGRDLMEFAAVTAARKGVEDIILNAQVSARDFYARLGYLQEGPLFDDAGIPHVLMRKQLSELPCSQNSVGDRQGDQPRWVGAGWTDEQGPGGVRPLSAAAKLGNRS